MGAFNADKEFALIILLDFVLIVCKMLCVLDQLMFLNTERLRNMFYLTVMTFTFIVCYLSMTKGRFKASKLYAFKTVSPI